MSREIKFRAWDKKHRKYTKVLKIYFGSGGNNLGALVEDYETNYALELQANQVELEQYTGLKDKNDKEIYEGDIMRFDAIDYEIYWADDFSSWNNWRVDGGARIYGSNSFEEVTRFGSVIGNIHENPELLEDK